jgi:hypothetical protein
MDLSVVLMDWKMFLIFFLAGADPDQNLFGGILWMPTTGELLLHAEALRSGVVDFPSVPGFLGLQYIMDVVVAGYPEDVVSKMRATLWLTEQLHGNATIVLDSDMISRARRNCLLLDNSFDWESAFSSKVTSGLALLKQISGVYQVPAEALHSVIKHRSQLLHGAIRECLEGIVEGLGPGLEEANEE